QSRPNIVGDPTAGRQFPDHYLNPAAFDFPRDAQGIPIRVQGNAGRNTIQQPGIDNWDMGVYKNFRMRDRLNLQVRWETFNTWNHTQFGSANLSTSSLSFGRITSTRVGPRRMQFGLRLPY